MLRFQLPVTDEIAFAKLPYTEKERIMKAQLDIYMFTNNISAISVNLDPVTRMVVLEGEVEEECK